MKIRFSAPRCVLLALITLLLTLPACAQRIDSVIHSARSSLNPGDKLHVIMTGTPGGTAVVEILGIQGTEPMREVSSGRYEADITIPSGMAVNNGTLMVNLNVAGRQAVKDAAKPITILASGGGFTPAPPTPPPASNAIFPISTSPQPGEIVQKGSAWTFEATFPVDVDTTTIGFFVNGVDRSNEAIRSTRRVPNFRTIAWSPTGTMPNGKVSIDLAAFSTTGQALEESLDFFIQSKTTNPNPNPIPKPAPPTTPTHKLSVNNLQGGMLLGNKFAITGTGIPGANVMATVEHPKMDFLSQLAGIMLKFQGQATVDSSGRYSIPLDAGSVRKGQPLNITVTDTSGSSPVRVTCEKGDGHLRQASSSTPPPSKPTARKPTPFFDSQNGYGFDIMPGWSKEVDKNFHTKIANGSHSSFGVAIFPANQTVDQTIKILGDELIKQGGKVLSHESLNISGIPSKAIVVEAKAGSEGIMVVTPKNNKLYVAVVESTKLSSDPAIERDMTHILGSYHLK
jgi:hypothetical protein